VLLTTREAGRRLHISAVAIHKLAEAGLLPFERNNRGLVLIPEEELRKIPITPEDIVNLVRQKQATLKAPRPKETSDEQHLPSNA